MVTDWSDCYDPHELRRLLGAAEAYIGVLAGRIERLQALLATTDPVGGGHGVPAILPAMSEPDEHSLPCVNGQSPGTEKIALFRTLFRGREDVYAYRWVSKRNGKVGWSPDETDRYSRQNGAPRVFLPLTDDAVQKHLEKQPAGEKDRHVGLYPLTTDDRTWLLVCDFDGKDESADWRRDAEAYLATCAEVGVPAYAEISRSGAGAHVWTFFTAPVSAAKARALGTVLLRNAIDRRGQMALASYDRLFPTQDFAPVKANGDLKFGNLIALPLHGPSRLAGTTVFCTPGTWTAPRDQFALLSAVRRLTPSALDDLVTANGAVTAGPVALASELGPKPRRTQLGPAPAQVRAQMDAMLSIATEGLSAKLLAALKHLAAFHNPEFYRRQAQRFSTWNTPRLVCCFDASDPGWLRLPRGVAEEAASLIAQAGGVLEIESRLREPATITATFTGILTETQTSAVQAMIGHDCGVLVAPPGSGKTVMACALIANYRTPTVVIVNRTELANQWGERLEEFLDLGEGRVGSAGAGRDRRHHVVDVVMLQTLSHRDASPDLLDGYGLAVFDECHSVGAPAAAAAMGRARIPRWIGLSATPYRADQMDPIITMQCGPIRHEIIDTTTFAKYHIVHTTTFTTNESGTDTATIAEIYNQLARDTVRTKQIAADIADAVARGRCVLALTNRIEHLTDLGRTLDSHGITALQLYGRMPRAERSRVLRAVADGNDGQPIVLLAIDKLIGQGFDAPRLDTVFLATPIAFKTPVIQQVGRIMRHTEARKEHVEAHDYRDDGVPVLQRMYRKRRATLHSRGFTTITPTELPATTSTAAHKAPSATAPDSSTVDPAPPLPTTPQSSESAVSTSSEVRAWAIANGLSVSPKGRVPERIWEAWRNR
ncbi:TOTE conflict system archaeo-eukaryotic primase domain-containing protein [Nocardia sp. CA-151230]|uniref:TOTE conflict system archaeo-eukaryotic primase domain-containing protein n=1 Tax=Nocardia sp. CA-151230 TaxID=3239982 RepID=UPI003D8F82BF